MTLSAQDLAIRSSGLGGTDVVALFGEGRRRRIDVWREKRGEADPFDGNERTEWGSILEPVVAAKYQKETGMELVPYDTLRRRDRPWHLGTPDRGCFEPDIVAGRTQVVEWARAGSEALPILKPHRGLEIKTHGFRAGIDYGEEGSDAVPDDKRIQCAWYMALLDVDEWDLAALIDTHLYRVYRIPRDKELEGYLLEESEHFWNRNIVGAREPDPDGSESFSAYLKKRFVDHKADMIQAPAELAELLEEEARLSSAIKVLETKQELVKQTVQSAIGSSAGLLSPTGAVLCTWKRDAMGKVATSILIEKLIEIAGLTDMQAAALMDSYRGTPTRRFLNKLKTRKGA